MAAGVLERHASVAGSPAGTARAPPAGLGPTAPARDASPCLHCALPPGACSRRARERSIAFVPRSLPAPDSAAASIGRSTGATRSTSPKSAGITLVRQLGHEEPRLPPRVTIARRSRARLGAGPGTPQGGHPGPDVGHRQVGRRGPRPYRS